MKEKIEHCGLMKRNASILSSEEISFQNASREIDLIQEAKINASATLALLLFEHRGKTVCDVWLHNTTSWTMTSD